MNEPFEANQQTELIRTQLWVCTSCGYGDIKANLINFKEDGCPNCGHHRMVNLKRTRTSTPKVKTDE